MGVLKNIYILVMNLKVAIFKPIRKFWRLVFSGESGKILTCGYFSKVDFSLVCIFPYLSCFYSVDFRDDRPWLANIINKQANNSCFLINLYFISLFTTIFHLFIIFCLSFPVCIFVCVFIDRLYSQGLYVVKGYVNYVRIRHHDDDRRRASDWLDLIGLSGG